MAKITHFIFIISGILNTNPFYISQTRPPSMPTLSSLTFKPTLVKQIHNAFFFNLGLGGLAVAGLS
jgi:hypothetical protein